MMIQRHFFKIQHTSESHITMHTSHVTIHTQRLDISSRTQLASTVARTMVLGWHLRPGSVLYGDGGGDDDDGDGDVDEDA